MKRVVWLVVVLLFVGCSPSEEGSIDKTNSFVSTGSNNKTEDSQLESFLKGEWLEVEKNCNSKGKSCETVDEQVLWVFARGEVKWGNFTHALLIKKDTLYITGSSYRIVSEFKDTLLFHTVKADRYFKLVRKQ